MDSFDPMAVARAAATSTARLAASEPSVASKICCIFMKGTTHVFDSFECAIRALAPTCAHCGTHIVGHGLENSGMFFCCKHCAEKKGVSGLRDSI
jgi:hypothetical protein